MVSKRTGKPRGRPKKPLPVIPEPKKAVGRPETLNLRRVAFYVAHSKLIKMRTIRGNRTLGDNMAALWLTALAKAGKDGLLLGAAGGDVPNAPKDYVENCPDGAVPIVPMQHDAPITIQQVAGSAKAMQKKAAEVLRTTDAATHRRFVEMVAIFGLFLEAHNRAGRGLWTEARGLWAEAASRAICLGETEIASGIAHISEKVLGEANPLAILGVPERQFPTT